MHKHLFTKNNEAFKNKMTKELSKDNFSSSTTILEAFY
jgi:hypothetical protein